MKLLLAAVAAAALAGPALAAQPAEGLWQAPDKNSQIEIYGCGAAQGTGGETAVWTRVR